MMPHFFALDEFLHWLRTVDGLRLHVTLRDYRRIQQVLLTQGAWTHRKLQQVLASLLVHDPEQSTAFAQAYRQFFALTIALEDAPLVLDVPRLRAELQQLGQCKVDVDTIIGSDQDQTPHPIPPPEPPLVWWRQPAARRWLAAGLMTALLIAVVAWVWQPNPAPLTVTVAQPNVPATPEKLPTETIVIDPTIQAEVAPSVVDAATHFSPWWWLLPLAGAVFTGFAVYRRRELERVPALPAALPLNLAGKAYFDPARIGGVMPAWLDKDTLDYCADSVGFFLTEEASNEPDMPATIRATLAAGGVPEIRFLRRKQLFHLLILTDVLDASQGWNPLAQELADGLRQRGLPVTVGRVRGSLREFHTDNGQHLELRELAEERGHYVTLVFADAGLPDPLREPEVLDELCEWPQLGWLTPREPRHWGGAEQRLQQRGIHLWEATPANLGDVFRHLAGEMLRNPLAQVPDVPWRVAQPHESLGQYLPRVLGDALPLARLAALFPPPVSAALLVRLLQTFCPTLPLTRLQRLYRLPDSTHDAGGLAMSVATLKLLRQQFYDLHEVRQRRSTIETLLMWMQEAEPPERDSAAWWGWRWRYARLLAELDIDRAYPLLAAVERSGVLAEGLAADLDSLPVTAIPQRGETLKSLYQLGKRHGFVLLEKAQALPRVPFWDRLGQWGGAVTLVLALGVGAWQVWPVAEIPLSLPEETPPSLPLSGEELKIALPVMVKIPGGTFEMGCVENNKDCPDDEKPVHTVTVPAFEMGAYEVTVGQFRAFVAATGYQTTAEKSGSCWSYGADGKYADVKGNSWQKTGYTQTEDSPVTCVSWQDAQAYLKWLSEQTKQVWRLPTEAEWEYAARGGTKTAYSWGDQPPVCDTQAANGAQFVDCKEKAPLKVGSFKPNPQFGLYDVHGNALEWVEDCWQGDYKDAPIDGSARQGCDADASRVLRGGSWTSRPLWLRSAARDNLTPAIRTNDVGFRAARTINPLPFTEGGTQDQLAQAIKEGETPPNLPLSGEGQSVPVPTMVQIPAGKFTMGCDPKRDDVEGGCSDDEKPAHEVNVPTFWLSETEVTVAQYMACVKAGACPEPEWQEKGSDYNIQTGKDDHYKKLGEALTGDNYPIVGVSWQNAQAYVQWLSKQTSKKYRLPTEAEWEYAARAGTDTAYSWGNKASHEFANYGKDECCGGLASGKDKWVYTSPVGSFAKNPFALADMHGNVLEWVEDCYVDSYKDAPIDGSARQGCDADASRVLRGGSWLTLPQWLRSATRNNYTPDGRNFDVGFRAARTN